jgi:DNA (cytosine-5)-methyltransferase 3A
MNVLSLFDGMSCGQQALVKAGIKYDKYFASEIDKYAITVTMANFPKTIQLGSVVNVDGYALPKIDLLIGGSPCQSFSFAGKRKGMSTKDSIEILTLDHYLELKSQQYEFEGQSYLFWEYMRLLNETKPKNFLLENVMMGQKWEKVLSAAIGVKPIMINSSLVSAQNRKRLYWTNIGMESAGLFGEMQSIIQQPKDKGVLLKDILEPEVDEKYYLSDKMMNYLTTRKDNFNGGKVNYKTEDKASCINKSSGSIDISDNIIVEKKSQKDHLIEKTGVDASQETEPIILDVYNKRLKRDYKVPTLTDPCHGTIRLIEPRKEGLYAVSLTEVRTEEAKAIRRETGTNPKRAKELAERTDDKTGALLTYPTNDNLIKEVIAREDFSTFRIRRLTPIECERLQTVADNYTNHVSDSQRYKMLGNGWTVDVIAHIFSYLKK